MKTNLLKSTMVAALAIFGTGVNAQIDTTQLNVDYTTGYSYVDFNDDGINDMFVNINNTYYSSNYWYNTIQFVGQNGAQVLYDGSTGFLSSFEENAEIGMNLPATGNRTIGKGYYYGTDYWASGSDEMRAWDGTEFTMAVKFIIDGNYHMGWADFSTTKTGNNVTLSVTNIAYEMQDGVAIFNSDAYPTSYGSASVLDVASEGNISDLRVDVTPSTSHVYADSVTHAYVMFVKDDGREFSVNNAMSSDAEEIEFTGAASYVVKANPWTYDSDGEVIVENYPYNVYVGYVNETLGDILRLSDPTPFTLKATVDVQELAADKVEVFSTDKTIVINSNLTSGVVNVVDLTGKVIYNGTISSSREEIKLNNATGIYLVNVVSSSVNTTVKVKM